MTHATRRRKWIVLYICVRIILILFLTSYYIIRYVLRRRSPVQMVYETDVVRFSNATWARRRIPRLIHQTSRTHDIPLRWNVSYHSVITKNAVEFKHHLWVDDEMRVFVEKHEPEFYKNTYSTYQYEIQRADSFRYVVLYHLGGIYININNGCKRPFKDLPISTPGHPLYKQFISS